MGQNPPNESRIVVCGQIGRKDDYALERIEFEQKRAAGEIGSSLQAEVELGVSAADLALLGSLGDDLKFVLITSKAAAHQGAGEAIEVAVAASSHAKCERCWHYRADVGVNAAHPAICDRCVDNLFGSGEHRRHA